ncbi:CHASE2 domain-containing protein [Roseospira navarrensis]|uniref:CHASE2 domain-containing protein n=1 Tax=Roseospira navarrensis TaxID=140058 RepID=A0A7X2D271_9PROT|nr:adenylate/guanylate cyclase domain-containing protein [Roseospira navarrensis]MQX35994.1 CHASE2 domain-containing protein [Roseospira navarrensis]
MVAALTAAMLGLYVTARDARLPAEVEAVTLDVRFRLRGPVPASGAVALAMVDDRTLAALGGGTVARTDLARAVAALDGLGARAVVLNLLLEGRTEGVPAEAARVLQGLAARLAPSDAALIRGVLGGDGGTRSLAEAMNAALSPVAVPFGVVVSAQGAPVAAPPVPGLHAHGYRVVLRDGSAGAGPGADAVRPPSPALLQAADAAGHALLILDADGALRHHDPVVTVDGTAYPSLAVQAARVALRVAPEDLAVSLGRWVRIGPLQIPLDRAGRIAVNHYGPPGVIPTVSLIDVIEGRGPAESVRNRLVLIGAGAVGFGARFPAPFAENLTAAEHVATMIDNIVSGRMLTRGEGATLADAAAILAGGVLAGTAALLLPYGIAAGVAVGLALAWGGAALWALTALGMWLNVAFPVGAVATVFVPCALWRRVGEQRRRRLMERQRHNLSRYVSPAMVESLANRDAPFAGDRMIDAAVLFVDMRESTRICDGLDPREAMDLLRAFLSVVERCVFDHDGVLDRFQGDGAMASFGPPEPTPAFALNALRAARCLAESVGAWSALREAEGHLPIRIGVGVHCGRVLMGELGGQRQFAFTLSGETVAIASRLEGMTKTEGCAVLVSGDLLAAARAVAPMGEPALEGFRALGERTVRGRSAPLDLWAV